MRPWQNGASPHDPRSPVAAPHRFPGRRDRHRPDADQAPRSARRVRAAGLSLNLICQQVPDQFLRQWLADGGELSCLFLDPDGEAIGAREREEDHLPGNLSKLTRLNIDILDRFRDRLPDEAGERLRSSACWCGWSGFSCVTRCWMWRPGCWCWPGIGQGGLVSSPP